MQTTSQSTSTLRKVPTLSLAAYNQGSQDEKVEFIEQLFIGIKDYGFVILKDHDVSPDLLAESYKILEKL